MENPENLSSTHLPKAKFKEKKITFFYLVFDIKKSVLQNKCRRLVECIVYNMIRFIWFAAGVGQVQPAGPLPAGVLHLLLPPQDAALLCQAGAARKAQVRHPLLQVHRHRRLRQSCSHARLGGRGGGRGKGCYFFISTSLISP